MTDTPFVKNALYEFCGENFPKWIGHTFIAEKYSEVYDQIQGVTVTPPQEYAESYPPGTWVRHEASQVRLVKPTQADLLFS